MKIYLILIAVYIVQILAVLAFPYYMFRRDYKEERTIGSFMNYIEKERLGYLKLVAFFPYLGITVLILGVIAFLFTRSLVWIYEKFIKNIKI